MTALAVPHKLRTTKGKGPNIKIECTCGFETTASSEHFATVLIGRHLVLNEVKGVNDV